MTTIDDACRQVVQQVEGGIACGVVDLDSGALLGVYDNARGKTLNEGVAAAARNLFRGEETEQLEHMVRELHGGQSNDNLDSRELHITSKQKLHFAKTIGQGKAVMMLVTNKSTNIGMGWAQLKAAVAVVEALLP